MDPLDSPNSRPALAAQSSPQGIAADLVAVLVAVTSGEPRVLTIQDQRALPSGPFELAHRSLQSGLRAWVERQTRLPLGYVEQLYTFADRDRAGATGQHVISISYLGLTREQPTFGEHEARWRGWYHYFPWEDHRDGPPPLMEKTLQPGLKAWASAASDRAAQRARRQRAAMLFGFEEHGWNEELVLQRYELLYEAKLIPEATRGDTSTSTSTRAALPNTPGHPMILDHRRILATGIARLRAKIKYHPVVFELMPDTFTLLQLQRCVEALAGRQVHKPNFRRLIEQQELVEETGETSQDTGGRPAKLFRFRRAVLAERAITGTKLPISGA
ncbi:MAG: hypothetical protein V4477_23115 [Pseudomonadota bacterium]